MKSEDIANSLSHVTLLEGNYALPLNQKHTIRQEVSGSRNVENTLLYIQLEVVLFQESDEFTDRVTEKLDEAVKWMKTGFEYVTDIKAGKGRDFVIIFFKRKQHAENV